MQNVLIDDRRIWVDLWVPPSKWPNIAHTYFSQLAIRLTLEQWTMVQ